MADKNVLKLSLIICSRTLFVNRKYYQKVVLDRLHKISVCNTCDFQLKYLIEMKKSISITWTKEYGYGKHNFFR